MQAGLLAPNPANCKRASPAAGAKSRSGGLLWAENGQILLWRMSNPPPDISSCRSTVLEQVS